MCAWTGSTDDDWDPLADAAAISAIAPFYDLDFGALTDDLAMYREFAAGGRALELGAGTGRVACALAEAGCDVTALELDPGMREQAATRCRAAGVRLVDGDMRAPPDLGEPFDLVICALSTFCHLPTRRDQLAVLRGAAGLLRPGGRLILDLPALQAQDWEEGPRPPLLEWTRPRPDGGGMVMKFATLEADPASQTQRVTYIYDEMEGDGGVRRTVARFRLRHVFRFELWGLLESAGLCVDQEFGSYDLDPVGEGDRLIVVAGIGRGQEAE